MMFVLLLCFAASYQKLSLPSKISLRKENSHLSLNVLFYTEALSMQTWQHERKKTVKC